MNERRLENWDVAKSMLTQAHATFSDLGVTDLAEDAESRLLELDVFRGEPDPMAIADARSRWGDGHPLRSRIEWIHGIALAVDGDTDAAIAVLEAEVDEAEGVNHARTVETLLALAPDHPDADRWHTLVDREYRAAGVVSMPRLPFVAAS